MLDDGQINYADYGIVGQSYVWKSHTGNITLDSIEYGLDTISNEALKNIITDFANTVLIENPDIKCVTVGSGGKTPEGLFDRTNIPELMRNGKHWILYLQVTQNIA